MPSGWVSVLAYFKLHTDAIIARLNHFRPRQSLLSGMGRFNSYIYVGYFVLIGFPVGGRLGKCASYFSRSCVQILDDDSSND